MASKRHAVDVGDEGSEPLASTTKRAKSVRFVSPVFSLSLPWSELLSGAFFSTLSPSRCGAQSELYTASADTHTESAVMLSVNSTITSLGSVVDCHEQHTGAEDGQPNSASMTRTQMVEWCQQWTLEFEAQLSLTEREHTLATTMNDFWKTVHQMQSEHQSKGPLRHLARTRVFIERFRQMERLRIYLGPDQDASALVLGSMIFLLQVSDNLVRAYDMMIYAYEKVGRSLPVIGEDLTVFANNEKLVNEIADVYDKISAFHDLAIRFLQRPRWQQLVVANRRTFDRQFQSILSELRRHKTCIEVQISEQPKQ